MTRTALAKRSAKPQRGLYVLEDQIGFILRQVWQRHATIFAREIGINLTPTQWAALAKLTETGPCSQNQLGRLTAMDVATIKGVIDRLTARGLTETSPDPADGRRLLVSLTRAGQQLAEKVAPNALAITRETMAPLAPFNGTSPEMAILASELRTRGLFTVVRWHTFFTNPPLSITDSELSAGFEIIDHALNAVDQMLA